MNLDRLAIYGESSWRLRLKYFHRSVKSGERKAYLDGAIGCPGEMAWRRSVVAYELRRLHMAAVRWNSRAIGRELEAAAQQ